MSKASAMATIATTLFAASVTWAILLNSSNASLKDLLSGTRLEKEQLLSEKIAVEKDLKNTSLALDQMKGKNAEMDKTITALQSEISSKEAALKNLAFTNKKALEQESAKLRDIKKELETSVDAFNRKIQLMENNMAELSGTNAELKRSIAMLESENTDLKSKLTVMQSMSADNYLVETTKGKKDKLTISARKTDNIQINFAIPAHLNTDLRCSITTPEGKVLNSRTDAGFSFLLNNSDEMYASLYYAGGKLQDAQNVMMQYKPDHKLKSGLYEIDIYSDKVHLGNCKIRLK